MAAVTDSPLAATLRRFAVWHGTPELMVRRTDPPELLERISAGLPG